ncbi:MAG: hypothetical protein WA020_15790, partial [Candidatus Acidiferrales bacterium]
FVGDPRKAFLRMVEVLSVPIDFSASSVPPPKAKPYGYLAVQERVPRFRDFIDGLDLQTKRRMEKIGYGVECKRSASARKAAHA